MPILSKARSPHRSRSIRDRGFDQMFRDGQVAMFMGGAADNLDSTIDHVEAFMVPAGPDGIKATFADVLGMAVNVKTKHPEEAVQALLDLTDAIHHWKIMPPRQSLSDLSTLQEMHPEKAHSLRCDHRINGVCQTLSLL